jgi:eukaryotic-like serine/threonine-protein kinase
VSARARNRRKSTDGPPHGKIALVAAAVALAAFGIGYGVTALAFTRGGAPAQVVTVPDVRELSERDARRSVNDRGLDLEVGDSLPNPNVEAGYVLAQSPLPGHEVGPGSSVRIILSTGRPQPRVPDVEAMPLALATRAMQAVGFDVEIDEVPSDVQQGRIVDVEPAIGSPVRLPATVRLLVSSGPPYVSVPPLVGLFHEHARDLLEETGLELGAVEYEPIDFGDEGYVLEQHPLAGDTVPPGGQIRIRVSQRRGATDARGRGRIITVPPDRF